MRISSLAFAALGVVGSVTGSAMAGFVATTNANVYSYTNSAGNPANDAAPAVGDKLTITGGTFAQYQPDGPSDPQILFNDLAFYKMNLNLTVVQASGPVRFTGTYKIFYDNNMDGIDSGFNPSAGQVDAQVSAGTATMNFNTVFLPAFAFETGIFQQSPTGGPQPGTPLRDLSYGGLIGVRGGIYLPGSDTLQFAITVPEPTTLAGIASLGLIAGRRRRA